MAIAIVGSGGFVGGHLVHRLASDGVPYREIRRRSSAGQQSAVRVVDEGSSLEQKTSAIAGCSCLVILAARVHQMRDRELNPLVAHMRGNRDVALEWSIAAASAGVKRLIFLSSVKAATDGPCVALKEDAPPHPTSPYGVSKLAAEQALLTDSRTQGIELVILRSPLVYGPGVRANFRQLMEIASLPVPLPLASARARRSLISVRNLVDAILACAIAPNLAREIFYVADQFEPTIAELVTIFRGSTGRGAGLVPVPEGLLRAIAAATGRTEQFRRLFDPLTVDTGKIRRLIGWAAPFDGAEELRKTYKWFIQNRVDELP
jgi:nucleoside-diphosphate-sugar epimerase